MAWKKRMRWCRFVLLFACCSSVNSQSPAQAQVMNGGFETGNISGWTSSGNGSVQVLTAEQFAPLQPTEGTYFALLGSGPSDVGGDGLPDVGILTSNSFVVPSGGSQLQYDWDFLTAEFTGLDADPAALDSFTISLLQSNGPTILLTAGDVSQSGFVFIDGGDVVSAPDGTSVLEHLGFQTGVLHLNPGTYSLEFRVQDFGDGNFDSALLIDNVALISPSAVPEPASWMLFIIASFGIGLNLMRRWKAGLFSAKT